MSEHIKDLEKLSEETQPVRLRYAKLRKRLDAVDARWERNRDNEGEEGIDAVEITLENQVGKRSD